MQNWKMASAMVSALVGAGTGMIACTGGTTFGSGDGGTPAADGASPRADGAAPGHDGATSHDDTGTDGNVSHHDTGSSPSADGAPEGGKCDPSGPPKTSPCSVTDALGVFVAPAANGGSDSGQGTRASPFATIAYAIAHAGSKRVYACGGATYAERLTVTASVQVYGGLACPVSLGSDAGQGGPAWGYTGALASVAPVEAGYPLNVQVVTGAAFVDMEFIAQGADSTNPGSSSIAVMLNQSTDILLARVKATSGSGAPGVAGAMPASNWCAAAGQAGSPGGSGNGTASGGECACAVVTGDSSQGGSGGAKTTTGGPGTSTPAASASAGASGAGGGGTNGTSCSTFASPGANGAALDGGAAGAPGTLNGNGWMAATGGDGLTGNPGQGGGGGGGILTVGGAGGGAGGCGGTGGSGGAGGGASFAIAVVNGSVFCEQVTLETTAGGAGGGGAAGQPGQAGGSDGADSLGGCNGAVGGQGAGGSGGGGGAGGPSVGIAVVGVSSTVTIDGKAITPPAVSLTNPSVFSPGGGGAAGGAGAQGAAATGGKAGNEGAPGPAGTSAAVATF
jgi:hypothetical protein